VSSHDHSYHPVLGKFNADAAAISRSIDAKHEELAAAYERIKQLEGTLGECREYFDQRSDADCDQDGYIPNEEMKLLCEIDEVMP
jgi:hypothetical protein